MRIDGDRRARRIGPLGREAAERLGQVPPEQLAALDAAIKTTDFAVLKSHPFTGECPTAFDGQELVFEFGAPGGTQRIATCEIDVDYGSPLFIAVGGAIAAVRADPA